jgi:SAM-dependent methyltransferase
MMTSKRNFDAARAFVEFGLEQHSHGRGESPSGPGSAKHAAATCLALIDVVVNEYAIRSIVDLGCGDWNWMQHAKWRSSEIIYYEGREAHPGLVRKLTMQFGNERTRFRVADICSTPLPNVVICRDVLFHLPLELAELIIGRLQTNRALFISTSFLDIERNIGIQPYLPIENWGFYPINLDAAPFNLKRFRVRDAYEAACDWHGHKRSICLYAFK